MTRRLTLFLLFAAALATVLSTTTVPGLATDAPRLTPAAARDSARGELAAGRYWHAARLLRDAGAHSGPPADVLALARAEAGWKNWSAVVRLLDGADWLGRVEGGAGRVLLGGAYEAAERWPAAADQYGRYLAGNPAAADGTVIRARWARTLWLAGARAEALAALDDLASARVLRSWVAAERAAEAARAGDTAAVRELLTRVDDEAASAWSWRIRADGRLAAGDSAGSESEWRRVHAAATGARRGTAAVELGRLALSRRDSTAARPLMLEGFETARGGAQARAAAALLNLVRDDRELALELARVLDRAGDNGPALRAYDRVVNLSRRDGIEVPERARLERARLMGTVPARQEEALEEFRAIRETTRDEAVGARNLEVWAQMRRRQGLDGQVRTLRGWLVEQYPASSEAAEVVWAQGSSAESSGRLDEALRLYAQLSRSARTHARAGEARMRSGQIYLGRSDLQTAARVFEAYLTDFPDGRRWQEAAYWAGRTRAELGDTAAARRHIARLLAQDPVSYYTVMGAELMGTPYRVDVPPGDAPEEPAWLTDGLVRLDRLTDAGLEAGAGAEVERLGERAASSKAVRLRLAEALIERGRTIDGINIGWALRGEGHAWDQRLLRVAYPFPYRELVVREAREWGVDPIVLAAIIRQESAFKADIVSSAGAVGLMQVMPPTGAELARTHGPDGFDAGNLTAPEVNLHLGAAFFVDMSRRYAGDLPLVLSAYNAGPTRANRWRRFPEVSDPLRFTERIPFEETRGYVKNVRRNLELYRLLYGDE